MTPQELDRFFVLLSQGSDRQIDKVVGDRLLALRGKPLEEIEVGLKSCLDDSAYGSLASDFTMMAMDHVWKTVLKKLGKEPYYGPSDVSDKNC